MTFLNSIRLGLGCGVAASMLGLGLAAAAQTPTGPGSLSGIWTGSSAGVGSGPQALSVADGKPAPLQPWARQLLNKRIKQSGPGRPFVPARSLCLPASSPAMFLYPGLPIQILESPGQVTMLSGKPNHYRIIRLSREHVADPDPTFKGDSIGHWEGDTLVVDTIGLNDKTTLDPAGTPHSEDLHLVERFHRVAGAIEVTINLEDPKTFTRPWTAKTRLTPISSRIVEDLCDSKSRAFAAFGHAGAPPSKTIR